MPILLETGDFLVLEDDIVTDYTLCQACLDTARALRIRVSSGVATGGSATTLIDTAFPWTPGAVSPANDYYIGGTIFFTSGTRAATTGTANIITDSARSGTDSLTQTFTFPTGTTVVATNGYSVIDSDYSLDILRQAVNFALKEIGNVMQISVSQTTVVDQAQYTLPSGVRGIKKIRVAASTVSPYDYYEVSGRHWEEVSGKLNVDRDFQDIASGYNIEYNFLQSAAELTTDAGTISDNVNPELIKWYAAAWAAGVKNGLHHGENKWVTQVLQEALTQKEIMKARYIGQVGRDASAQDDSAWLTGGNPAPESTPGHVRFRA